MDPFLAGFLSCLMLIAVIIAVFILAGMVKIIKVDKGE